MGELSSFGVGVATADPEMRFVGDKKTALCTVNLAFNRSYKDKDDEWQSEPCFVKAQVWGVRAERMNEKVSKGQPIYVKGGLRQSSWEDKETGQKRVSYFLEIQEFQLCERSVPEKDKEEPKTAPKKKKTTEKKQTATVNETVDVEDDVSIPF